MLFALLIWVGVEGAVWLSARLGGLFWLPWALFGLWWVPLSLDLSHRLLGLPRALIRVELLRERNRRSLVAVGERTVRCPHCGERTDKDRAICPHCYEDLKTNCRECGRIIEAGAAQGLCDECRREGRPRYLAQEME